MEELKWHYLKIFLNHNQEKGLEDYINLVAGMETRTRKAYSEAPHMDSMRWVEMILLDGCFVLEFFYNGIGPIKNSAWVRNHVLRDMLLLENQLPFFLLVELLKLNSFYSQDGYLLPQITIDKFKVMMPANIKLSSRLSINDIDDILHLLYSGMLPELDRQINHSSLISCPLWVPSAKNLKDAGVVFKKKMNITRFMDITFQSGTLEIPQLQICGHSNSLFRNLIAFEQRRIGFECLANLAGYASLMDCIINTPADVEMLQQDGIIVRLLGNDDDVAQLFNQLGKNVHIHSNNYLVGVFTEIKLHCNKNKWMASLNHDYRQNNKYFNNPWASASIAAAFFLFLFTITQTLFTVVSYVRPRSP